MKLVRNVAWLAALFLLSTATLAQDRFPSRPIRIVSPFAAASVSDITLRVLAENLGPRLGTHIVVENQPTGGGIGAARAVINSDHDGHTLALLSNATAVSVALYKKLPYDPLTDFVAIGGISDFSYILLTSTKSQLRSLPDVIAAARARPGTLNFGTSASGTSPHLTALLFRKVTGVDFAIVPFRGASDLSVALMRGDVDVVINAYGAVKGNITDGSLRAIATTASSRAAVLRDVPTVAEVGIANFEVSSWNGLYAPARTPTPVVVRLGEALRASLAEPAVMSRFLDLGIEVRQSRPAEIDKRMREEIARWSRIIDEAGIERQ